MVGARALPGKEAGTRDIAELTRAECLLSRSGEQCNSRGPSPGRPARSGEGDERQARGRTLLPLPGLIGRAPETKGS